MEKFTQFRLAAIIILLCAISLNTQATSPVHVTATSGTTSGDYSTLKAAFDAINNGTHQGDVTIAINASTTETATAVLNASSSPSSYTSVNIYPTATILSISGNLATPLIDLNGADNVTIDGRVNATGSSKDLAITNTSTSATAETSTIRFINDASSNTVKYCTIKGSSMSAYGGVIYFSTTTVTTGNDNNTIDLNDITNAADANRPINAIAGIGTSGKENSGNTISNNNIFNFLNRSTISYGINIWNYNTTWSITGNSFYETASFVPTASVAYYGINIYYTSGNGFIVNNNFIGGKSSSCGGTTWTKTAAFNNTFTAINLNVGTGTATSVQGNTIGNFDFANSLNASWYGINVLAGAVNIGTLTANTIGAATGNGFVTLTNGSAGGSFYGIYISSTGTTNTQGNTIGSVTATNSFGTNSTNIYGIYKSGSGTTTISSNTIGSTITANSINASCPSTGNSQFVYGISTQSTGTIDISNNVIANLKNSCTGSSGQLMGISTYNGTNTISGNTIRDLSIANTNSSSDYMSSILGICNQSTAGVHTISGNTIYNLSNTSASFTGNVIGLYYQGSTTASTVSKNFIHSLSVASTTALSNIYGIKIYNGATTWSNNIISVGSNYNTNIYGIYENGDAENNNNLYFNTIYIYGDVGYSEPKSYALYSATSTNTRDFRNNIFDNQRFIGAKSPVGLYANYAAWFNYGVSTNLTLDNNDYYISGMGSGVLGHFNSANVPSLPLVSGQDANSKNADPVFASAGGTLAANYLPSNTSLIAATGTGITTDYANAARSVTYPSMGAYEYNVAPTITVTSTLGTPTGYYSTLKAAFDAINAGIHQGVITVKINNSTTETAAAVLNASGTYGKAPSSGSSSYTSINMYPTTTGLSISGNLATPLIDLNGADNVTIDGRVNATGSSVSLTISNASTSATVGTSTIRFISDASNNTVKYCTLKGSQMIPNIPGYGSGIVLFSTGTTTGNDGNLIDHNNITNAADVNRPINAIFSLGTSAMENSGNTISNNNIYDFLIREASFATGICVRDNNTNWTISGNSFYESALFATTGSTSYYFIIYIESGSGHTISSNYIGGSSAACSGVWTKTGDFQHDFIGICINSPSTGTACEIQGNIIRNINWTSGSGSFTGINVAGSLGANIGTTAANVVGAATGNGAITYTLNTTLPSQVNGIATTSTGTVWIQNNTVGAITTNNSNTGYPTNIYGILSSGTGDRVINANTIGSTAVATTNSIYASSPSTGASQTVYGIYSEGSGNAMIIANTVSKLTNGTTNSTAGTAGLINGITAANGTNTISGNIVRDLTIANANTAAINTASVTGIALNYTTAATQSITGNTIYNLSNTYASFAGSVIGLYYNGSTTSSAVSGNFIHSLSLNSANSAASIYGIKIDGGSASFSNNIISLGTGISTGYALYGIKLLSAGTNTLDLFYNTVYIGGTASSTTSNTYALSNGNGGNNFRTYKNNLFSNSRAGGSGGKHYAISVAVLNNLTIDYNDYYAPNGFLGFLGGDKTDLAAWKAATGQDIHSLNVNPVFATPGGTLAANYLPSESSLMAVTGTGITTDYAGITRSATNPAMGAWEYNVSSAVTVSATSGTLTGVYPTLKGAFDAINTGTHKGDITIRINSSTTESASAVLYHSGYIPDKKAPATIISDYTSVNVYPTVTGLSITGNLAFPLIDLNGADNVTIDGRVNATGSTKDLVISNTSTLSTSGTSTIRFINDACSNTVKYSTIKGSSTDTAAGIIFFSTAGTGTGNNANTIDNNDITSAIDANRPINAIYSKGTEGKENSGNTIISNNIYNFLSRGLDSQGINLSFNTTSCTILGNSFYETAAFVPTAEANYKLIKISNAGVNFTVSGNHIGGSLSACSGTWTKTNAFDNDFIAIAMGVGNSAASNIQGNTIKSFSWSDAPGKHLWCGIYGAGNLNVGTVEGNTIGGSTGTGSITYSAESDITGIFQGIFLFGTEPMDIRNNVIGSITVAGSNDATGIDFYGILNVASGTITISNNTIGSLTTANSINLSSPSTTWEQKGHGIFNAGTGSVTMSGNVIANMTNRTTNSSAVARGLIQGITTIDGSNTISNNTIRDLTIANADTAADYNAPVIGIALLNNSLNVQTITGNTIYNLSNTRASFAGNVIGLYYNGSTTASSVSRNFIRSLSVDATSTSSANIYGIKIKNGATTWSNNIISVGSNTFANIYGIYERGDALNDNNLYFNTIYIYGTVESMTSRSYALYSATSTNIRNFRNNIFDNQRSSYAKSPGGIGTNYSAWFNYNVSTNLTLDNNDYYASGNGGVLGYYNSANVIDLPLISGKDAGSKAISPAFASAGGTSAVNYLPSALGLIAATGTGILTDYAGTTRSLSTPSIGAWEYNANPPVTVTSTAGTSPAFYSTLKAAFDAINAGTHQGVVIVKINNSTTETAAAVLYASGATGKAPGMGGSDYTSVNVYPTVTGLSITGNLETPLIDLNGADNVTIDGRVNAVGSAKDLTISNTSTSSSAGTSTIRFINDASSDLIKYCNIKGSSTDASTGIIFFSTAGTGTGNDANTIDHNDITSATDANRPVNAVLSYGTPLKENSDLTISNNNIYDFLNRGLDSRGIYLYSNTTSCTISGNSFYETATFGSTAIVTYEPIAIDNMAGANFTVAGNFIGGSSAACGGNWITANENGNYFFGIYINVGNETASNIQGNTIKNFSWSYSGDEDVLWYAVFLEHGNMNVGTDDGNTIGNSTGNGSITITAGAGLGSVAGINMKGAGIKSIQKNIIGSFTVDGSDHTKGHFFTGISSMCSGTGTINNNKIGSETTANSINLISPSTEMEQEVDGIYNYGPGSVTISGNTIANMTNGTTNSSIITPGLIHGITTSNGSNTISGNTVRDLTIANANSNASEQVSVGGIVLDDITDVAQSITGNTIYNLSNTYASFAGNVIGLYYNGSTTASAVSGNFIHSLSVSPTSTSSANIYGIKIQNGATTWSNNIISVGSNYLANVYGIYERGDVGNDNNLYYNTIYISGIVVSSVPKSYALYSKTSTNTRNFRNNIFDNERHINDKSPSTGGYQHYAVWFNYSVSTNLTLDYNEYYAPGFAALLGHYNSADVFSLPIIPGQDASSKSVSPGFASAGGTSAVNYLPSALSLVAATGTGITTDYGGNTRSLTYPAMGAWEYSVTPPCVNPTSGGTIAAAQTICSGGTPSAFTSSAAPSGYTGTLEYKWQMSTTSSSAGFSDIASSNAETYASGTLTATAWFKRMARVSCKSDWTGAAESNVLQIAVDPVSVGGSIAGGTTVCSGSNTTELTLSGHTGSVVKWQKSTDNWTTPIDIVNTTTSLTATNLVATTKYRAVVQSGVCSSANSSDAIIAVDPVSVGGSIAGSTTVCSGANTTLLTLSGYTGSIIKWQKSTDNWLTPVDVANTTTTLVATNLIATTKYRAVVQSGVCSSANSSDATITVDPVSVGGSIAGSTTVCSGANTTLLTLSGYTGSIIKWQKSTDNWLTPVDVANTTTTLVATNLTATTKYRAVVQSGVCSSANSSDATITVDPVSVGGSIAGGTTVCFGSNTTELILSGHTGSVVKWQSSTDNWVTPVDVANTTTTLVATNLTSTTKYRAVVQSGVCSSANSSDATIAVDPVSVGGSIAGGTTVCSGSNTTELILSGHTGSVVKWQSSTDNWLTPVDVANTTTTLVATNLTATTKYRAVVQSGVCSSANSSDATITVDPVSVGGSIAGGTTVCFGSNTTTLTLSGHTGIVVTWQSSTDNWTTPVDIANTTTSLTATNLTVTTKYRAVVQSGVCASANSSDATIIVSPLPVPVITGPTINVCPNSGWAIYTTDPGNNNYIWTVSAGGTIEDGQGTDLLYVNWNTSGMQWVAVTYTSSAGCPAASPTQLNLTVLPIPGSSGAITGTATVCAGASGVSYYVAPVTNALAYVWNLPAGATILSGQYTNSIMIDFAADAASGPIYVAGNNLCGNGPSSPAFQVTVNPIPAKPAVTADGNTLTSSAANGNQWYWNSTEVAGATSQVYIVPAANPGNYWTIVTLNECISDSSNHVYVAGVGVPENESPNFNVFPVPNWGIFTARVNSSYADSYHILIYNTLGVLVHRGKEFKVLGNHEEIIDVSYLPSGIYSVILTNEQIKVVRKIFINK